MGLVIGEGPGGGSTNSGNQAWQSSTAYVVGQLVTNGGTLYSCNTAHTSGSTFSAESGDWTAISGSGNMPLPAGTPVVGQVPVVTTASPLALGFANGGEAAIIASGSLGATPTVALANQPLTQVTGTLTANCAMTVTGLTAGCTATLLLAQNGTGGWSLTINGSSVTIPSAANTVFGIQLWSPDGTTLYIQPGAINGVNGTKWWTSSGAPGTVTGAVTNDYYLRQSNGEVYQSTSGNNTWSDLGFSLIGPAGANGSNGSESRIDQRWKTLGLVSAAWDFMGLTSTLPTATPATQVLYGTLVGFNTGDVITNVCVSITTLGVGTTPSAIYLGVFSTSGTQLAISADVHASSIWTATAKIVQVAMVTPYTVPSSGSLYLCFLSNGTWGTTQLQLQPGTTSGKLLFELGSNPYMFVKQTGQSSMPSPATFVADGIIDLWFGAS